MNKFLCLALIVLTGCSTVGGRSKFSISKNLKVQTLNKQSYVIKDVSFYNSNVLVSRMPDDTVLIVSSPIDTTKTRDMLKWIEKTLQPKKIIAINTHFHADGTGGNEAYQEVEAEIWTSPKTHKLHSKKAATMGQSLADFIKNDDLKESVLATKYLPANRFVHLEEDAEWNFDDEKVIIHYPGPGHTEDNIVVYLPKQKILFGGCLLRAKNWKSLGNLKDSNLKEYPKSVESLLQFDASIVVPGHGRHGNRSLIEHTLNIVRRTRSKTSR